MKAAWGVANDGRATLGREAEAGKVGVGEGLAAAATGRASGAGACEDADVWSGLVRSTSCCTTEGERALTLLKCAALELQCNT